MIYACQLAAKKNFIKLTFVEICCEHILLFAKYFGLLFHGALSRREFLTGLALSLAMWLILAGKI